METKTCSKCGETKPTAEFYKNQLECKSCNRARNKAWRDANREKKRARAKAWYDANAEKVKARSKAWHDANPEKARAKDKAWRDANPEKANAWKDANPERIRALQKARIDGLADSYVAARLRLPVADCPPELIELKRQQLALYRLTKQLKEETRNVE